MTTVRVPTKRRPPPRIPVAGKRPATLVSVAETEPGRYEVKWRFSARNANGPTDARPGQFTLPQSLDADELGDMLHDLGLAGQDVDLEKLAGTKATLTTKTFGGRKIARVTGVAPYPSP